MVLSSFVILIPGFSTEEEQAKRLGKSHLSLSWSRDRAAAVVAVAVAVAAVVCTRGVIRSRMEGHAFSSHYLLGVAVVNVSE